MTSQVLLVEDNPADVRLLLEAFRDKTAPRGASIHIDVVKDGVEAMSYLRREGCFGRARRPGLILLDLNLPRKDGREVLAEIRGDTNLQAIPVVVLTTSAADEDVRGCYDLRANCYITKPVEFREFQRVAHSIEEFWLSIARLPPH